MKQLSLILISLCLLTSCAISKKSKDYHKSVTDSNSVVKTDSTGIKVTDSTGISRHEEVNEHTTETTIDTNIYIDSTRTRLYMPAVDTPTTVETPDKVVTVSPLAGGKGYYIDILDKPKTINVKGTKKETFKNSANSYDSSRTKKVDSSHVQKDAKTSVKAKVITENKSKNSFHIPWWVYVLAAVYIILSIYLRSIFPWKWFTAIKKIISKNKDNDNTRYTA